MSFSWPQTVNGVEYTAADFAGYGYVVKFPDLVGNLVAVGAAATSSATAAAGSATSASGSASTASSAATSASGSATSASASAVAAAASAASLNLPTISATFGTKHLRLNAAGTAWGFSTLTEDDSGNVHLGGALTIGSVTTTTHPFDIRQDQNASTAIFVRNNTIDTAAASTLVAFNGTSGATFSMLSAGFTSAGLNFTDGAVLVTSGSGGLTVGTSSATPLRFGTGNVVIGHADTSGNFHAAGSFTGGGADLAEPRTLAAALGGSAVAGQLLAYDSDGNMTNVFAAAVGRVLPVSTAPGFVGSTYDPENISGALATNAALVGLCGVVPVNITGLTAADVGKHLVPCAAADGTITATAVAKADLTLAQYIDSFGTIEKIGADGRPLVNVKNG